MERTVRVSRSSLLTSFVLAMMWPAAALTWTSAATAQSAQSPNFEQLDRSIADVQVTCPFRPDDDGLNECSGRATGVILSERQGVVRILTALHEVHGLNSDPNAKVKVTFAFDQLKPVPAKLLPVSNSQLDLAVLEAELPVAAAGTGTLPLTWQPRSSVQKNSSLWAVDGLWHPEPGSLVGIVHDQDGDRIRYTSNASNGYSGGPVFDQSGELVGIHLRSRPEIANNLRDGVIFDAAMTWLGSLGYTGESMNRLVKFSATSTTGGPKPVPDLSKLRPLSAGDRGTLLFRDGRYAQALPLLVQAAHQGDGHAATILGGMYIAGQGVPIDERNAVYYWQIGAKAGDAVAMSSFAASLVGGAGGRAPDYVQGEYWYRKAADLGDVQAMNGLGLLFANGQITPDGRSATAHPQITPATDLQAVPWFRRASQAGMPLAKSLLGIFYAQGRGGLPRNDAQAVLLYRASANSGETGAMKLLGDMYFQGRGGLARDTNQAIALYRQAAALGDASAGRRLTELNTR